MFPTIRIVDILTSSNAYLIEFDGGFGDYWKLKPIDMLTEMTVSEIVSIIRNFDKRILCRVGHTCT